MPIFMDRHDVRDATAEAVAAAHREDLKLQSRFSCKPITYWFDKLRGTAFCLIEAPTAAAVREMHHAAHGLIPNQIIEVDPATVEAFLGRITDPEAANLSIRKPAFRAIMFTDMVDSTGLTNAIGDEGALAVVRWHDEVIRRALLAHGGRARSIEPEMVFWRPLVRFRGRSGAPSPFRWSWPARLLSTPARSSGCVSESAPGNLSPRGASYLARP